MIVTSGSGRTTVSSRRNVLAGAAALGLGALSPMLSAMPPGRNPGQGCLNGSGLEGCPAPHRIDVHHHFIPPPFLDAAPDSARLQRSYNWSSQKAVEDMDRDGIAVGLLSFATPHFWFAGIEPGRRLARLCNDYSTQVRSDHPGRFGLFAGLPPLDDVDGALAEIDYAYSVLNADGIAVMTSYGKRYLGDPAYSAIWSELNNRNAIVFVHPGEPACCMNIDNGVPPGHAEWPFDTARTIMSLWATGSLLRWPNIRFIFSHAGGALPMIADRVDKFGRPPPGDKPGEAFLHDGIAQFRKLFYDTANAASPPTLAALLAFADPSHILFGSDYPYIGPDRTIGNLTKASLEAPQLLDIERGNALALMPQLL